MPIKKTNIPCSSAKFSNTQTDARNRDLYFLTYQNNRDESR